MNTNAETEIPGFLRSRLRPVTGDFIQGLFGVRSPSHSCLFVFIRGFLLRGYGFVASNVLPLLALALGVSSLSASPETDAKSLLAKMTLEEKIGQMVQVDSAALKDIRDVRTYFIGSVLSGGNSDPADNLPETWLKFVKEFRAQALQTRLKIPLL